MTSYTPVGVDTGATPTMGIPKIPTKIPRFLGIFEVLSRVFFPRSGYFPKFPQYQGNRLLCLYDVWTMFR